MTSHTAVITPNVAAVTPAFGHGETADRLKPPPRARSRSPSAAITKAPPRIAPQEVADAVLADAWLSPGTSTTTVSIAASSVPNKSEKKNDRDRHPQHPQQNSASHGNLPA